MGKDNKPLVLDGVEYNTEDFTEEQITLTNHCLDLDRKIANMYFQLTQLSVGKEAFVKMLKDSLEPKESKDS